MLRKQSSRDSFSFLELSLISHYLHQMELALLWHCRCGNSHIFLWDSNPLGHLVHVGLQAEVQSSFP